MKESNRFNLVYLILSTTKKFTFCNNTGKTPVLFTYIHHVPLIMFFLKNAKNKAIRKHKLPSHSTNNLKPKKSCDQSSVKAFYKGLLGKKGKLNMITSTVANKYPVVRRFGSSSIIGCSEKPSAITKF